MSESVKVMQIKGLVYINERCNLLLKLGNISRHTKLYCSIMRHVFEKDRFWFIVRRKHNWERFSGLSSISDQLKRFDTQDRTHARKQLSPTRCKNWTAKMATTDRVEVSINGRIINLRKDAHKNGFKISRDE